VTSEGAGVGSTLKRADGDVSHAPLWTASDLLRVQFFASHKLVSHITVSGLSMPYIGGGVVLRSAAALVVTIG
jgi:hypothetical protein